MLSEKAITKFKRIYKNKFGVKLSDKEAEDKGLELLNFFKLVYRPIPKEDEEFFRLKMVKIAI